jgi:predicted DNA-binding protein (MmcQ/YjbR family)
MPHPIMFDEDDPSLAQIRSIALGFPEAFEKISHGRPTFCVPKMFAMYGGNSKLEHFPGRSAPARRPGGMVAYPRSVLVKVDETDRAALQQDKRFFYPMYLGPYGWLGLDLTAAKVDWAEVTELVDSSYRMVATKKLVSRLDQG